MASGGAGGEDAEMEARIEAARARLVELKGKVATEQERLDDGDMREAVVQRARMPRRPGPMLKRRRKLEGHYGKVYNVSWGSSTEKLVSCSQDGKLILWDALNAGRKLQMVPLRTAWVMTCALDLAEHKTTAVGGLDDMCTVYGLGGQGISTPICELEGHEGYVSCCRYTDGANTLASSSGDSTCGVWDVTAQRRTHTLQGHMGDVMCVSPAPNDPLKLASGGCDSSARVWDLRTGTATHTFVGHESDVNAVQFAADGTTVVTGSDDSTCRVFDLRRVGQLNSFLSDKFIGSVTSVTLSRSGRLLFAGQDNNQISAYDVLVTEGAPVYSLRSHTGRVSCVSMCPSGYALATGSWDRSIGVWA